MRACRRPSRTSGRPAARRSASAISGSTDGGAGIKPSAAPSTIARSATSPTDPASDPIVTPAPIRPSRPGATSNSAANTDRNSLRVAGSPTRVEVAQPIEHTDGVLPRLELGLVEVLQRGRAEPVVDLRHRPVGPRAPRPPGARPAEVVAEIGDERRQRLGGVGGRTGRRRLERSARRRRDGRRPARRCQCRVRPQPGHPLVVLDDTGVAAGALPRRDRQRPAGAIAHGNVGEQVEQIAPAQAAAVDVEQVEQESRNDPLADLRTRTPVPRDAGHVEVMLDQPRVRSVGRPQDRHARPAAVPRRAASTTFRTAWRTSSSASVTDTTSVAATHGRGAAIGDRGAEVSAGGDLDEIVVGCFVAR